MGSEGLLSGAAGDFNVHGVVPVMTIDLNYANYTYAGIVESGTSTPEPDTKIVAGTTFTVGDITYKITSVGKRNVVSVLKIKTRASKVVIPDKVKYKGITFKVCFIENNACKKNNKVKSVVIGKNITTIGKSAFANCKKLKTVTIKGYYLEKVGKSAFVGMANNSVIKIPKNPGFTKKYKKILKSKYSAKKTKIKK